MITASALARVMACPGSETLPHAHLSTEASEAGQARHTFLQFIRHGLSKALSKVPEKYHELCKTIDTDGLPTDMASEVAFAYNWRTGEARELGRNLSRQYDIGPDEIAGTIDALGLSERLYIGDYKGPGPVSAKDNEQLLFAAMCGCKVYGRTEAFLEIINIMDGKNWRSRCTVDIFELNAFEVRLQQKMGVVAAYKLPSALDRNIIPAAVHTGPHCQYCPAYDFCPAKTQTLKSILGDKFGGGPITPENASEAYMLWQIAKERMSHISSAMHAYAAERDIDIGDGKIFGRREKKGNDAIDGDIAYRVVRDIAGQEAADIAVTRTATKTAITAAIRHGIKSETIAGTITANNKNILGTIRSAGGISNKVSVKTTVHNAELKS